VPIMVYGLMRLNKAYETETSELRADAKAASTAPIMRRHSVVVLVDDLDAAAARAMQYARTLGANDLRAVHFDLDPWKTELLSEAWTRLGLSRFPLDIIECPDRRVPRAALELAHELTLDHQTELTVLIPRREYTKRWHRMLHDRSSNPIAAALADLQHCSVTIVPYHLGSSSDGHAAPAPTTNIAAAAETIAAVANGILIGTASQHVDTRALPDDRTHIRQLEHRQRAKIAGRVRSLRVQPWSGTPSLEVQLADETGSITVVWFGRRQLEGVRPGTVMTVTGTPGRHHAMTAILNPEYEIISSPAAPEAPAEHH